MSENTKPIEYDKVAWGDGPWQHEPDRVEFKHEGFPCLILRTPMGHLCGYVAIPPNHPDYQKSYDDIDVDCHGGLTYASMCSEHICHIPEPGEPDNVYWVGFDHAHLGDYSPSINKYRSGALGELDETYKDIEFVTKGVKELAEQLKQRR